MPPDPAFPPSLHSATRLAAIVAGSYLILGFLWIALSSGLVDPVVQDAAAIQRWELFKGFGFIVVSAGLIFALTRGLSARLVSLEEAARHQRVEQRRAIEASERRFRAFMTHLPGAAFLKDAEGRYRFVSKGWEDLWSLPADEGLGRTDLALFGPEQAAIFTANDRQVLASGTPLTAVEHTRGQARLVTKFPVAVDGTRWVGGISLDISERVRAEEALAESREALRRLVQRLDRVREEEELQLARVLHDELGSTLTAVKLDLAWLARRLPPDPEATGRAAALEQLLDEMHRTVRRISRELRPGMLDDLGLVATLDWLSGEVAERAGLRATVEGSEPAGLTAEQRIVLYRIGQEALTNVARHAQASRVTVRLEEVGGVVCLEIEDDGRGITERSLREDRLGLLGMRERAAQIGGELHVSRGPEGGTRVRAEVPVA